jgi:transcriptional regulator with XRE-family HTH domain
MGNPRPKPERLAEKLTQIRNALGLSQTEMHRRLEVEDWISYTEISRYESGRREPSLMTLLEYARVAGVHMEVIVNDELDLPTRLPGPVKHQRLRAAAPNRRKKR